MFLDVSKNQELSTFGRQVGKFFSIYLNYERIKICKKFARPVNNTCLISRFFCYFYYHDLSINGFSLYRAELCSTTRAKRV